MRLRVGVEIYSLPQREQLLRLAIIAAYRRS